MANQKIKDYRHDSKRKNNPPAGMVSYEKKVKEPEVKKYAYDPHLSPQLVWAGKPGLKAIEVEDKAGVEAETVSLHVHERVSTQAILNAVQRKDKQTDMFADPELPLHEAVKFYQHDVDWANRLILGDSLLVANSMIERELMAGKVQMIYMDPPYGVKYSSNFQARIDQRDVKDGDEHLTREPEMIKAYRDTWKLGIHSYLTYMRDRLRISKDLLANSGSIFVQIGSENFHLISLLLDEIFGNENRIELLIFRKKGMPLIGKLLEGSFDYLLWYAKNIELVKFRKIFKKSITEGDSHWDRIELRDGTRRKMKRAEINNYKLLPEESDVYQLSNLYPSGTFSTGIYEFEFNGKNYKPPNGRCWKTPIHGMKRLIEARRIQPYEDGQTIRYILKLSDYPVTPFDNLWHDTAPPSDKVYVVQTARKVIERCILMSTDPGDLVFDPTCGSGTTAYVSEQWGRRWITCDTSRVALSLARQRLLTATFPYYKIEDDGDGQNPRFGFSYKTAPHITLKSIAQNTRLDPVVAKYNPLIAAKLKELNEALKKKPVKDYDPKKGWQEWDVPFEAGKDWSAETKKLHAEFRQLKRDKQTAIDRIIQEDASPEILYDRPEEDRSIVRVSGPFTVEAIPPPIYEIESPIASAPEALEETFGVRSKMESTSQVDSISAPSLPDSHFATLINLLRQDGVTFPNNRKLKLETLTARSGGVLHAEGEAEGKKYAFSFGPLHGAVSLMQVEDGLRDAYRGGYDEIIFCGFAFDPEAQAAIEANPHPKLKAHLSHIRPDVILKDAEGGDLLKTTASSQLFTVFGEPDIKLQKQEDVFTIELLGVDVYDPIDGTVHSENASKIAAWFIDTDYDGRTFCIVQAFFPNKDAWKKLERALKGKLDEDRFDLLTGQVSLPFKSGKHKKAAIKVIDQRGNEVMRVVKLDGKY